MSVSAFQHVSGSPRGWSRIGGATCLCLALALLFLFEPGRYNFYPRCLFHKTTGLLCPGCGSLRAVHQLLHGHLIAAFHFNAMLVMSLPVGIWLLGRWVIRERNGQACQFEFHPAWLWGSLAIGVLFGIVRNLPIGRAFGLAP
jgi:hypothetical protein